MDLEKQIEALLFFRSEPFYIKELASILGAHERAVEEALVHLEETLRRRGIRLMKKDDAVLLGTAPEAAAIIEKLIKEELDRDLGKAGLETLTIVLYRGPISRGEVDYIRGVNSRYILRHLEMRGLVERDVNPKDQRVFRYKPSFDVLQYLGITTVEELPEYSRVKAEFNSFSEHRSNESL